MEFRYDLCLSLFGLGSPGFSTLLADLTKWQTQPVRSGSGVVQHLCTTFLATSLITGGSYLAYIGILGSLVDGLDSTSHMWHLRGMFVAGTYTAIAWKINVAVCVFLTALAKWPTHYM